MKRLVLLAAAAALCGCVPALREPPPVHVLAGLPAASPAPESNLIAEANASFAKRPSAADVRAAEALYLKAAAAQPDRIDGILGAVNAKAWLTEHESDPKVREDLAVTAVQTAQWCGRRSAGNPVCDYWLAIALGLQAREKPSTAESAMKEIVPLLERAAKADPGMDSAGPERVLAIVLLRAPGWPLGPGDPETALDVARRAVERFPDYPPNQLALGEAQAKNGDAKGARASYERARALALARRDAGDPDAADWLKDAANGLSS